MTRTESKETLRTTMTAKESSAYIGCSYWKFLEDIKAGRIPHFRTGNRVLCRRMTLDAWMAAKEAASVRNEDGQEGYGKLRSLKA